MLTQLTIQGLAIIDALAIDFSHGFNVITGETGAGKSILIKALGLLLGSKASAETVRRGRDTATVTGLFEAPAGHRSVEVLERYEIPCEQQDDRFDIIIRRSVTNKGRSLAWINDVPVTAQVLKDLAATLIDVFGQHDNQRLLDPSQHLTYVDQFVKDKALLQAYATEYAFAAEKLASLTAMATDFRTKQRDADYLEFRAEELQKFGPARDDFEAVHALCQKSGSLLTLVAAIEKAQALVDQGADGGESLARPLWEMGKVLGKVEALSPELKAIAEQAGEIAGRLDDLSFALGKAGAGMDVDEGDLEAAQTRLAGYQELFRKLAVQDADGLVAEHERIESELGFLRSAAADVHARIQELSAAATRLEVLAEKLTKARLKAKDAVKARIEVELKELAMPGAVLDVAFLPVAKASSPIDLTVFGEDAVATWSSVAGKFAALSEHGAERAQFLLAANPGEDLHPLHKIASGGEISRIMLALKKGLAAGADTCILVFDEIDTGISGRVADVVGRKMQELSSQFQVICISHLAQVAAYADQHFLVHKAKKGERTESMITSLTARESEEEVARLLSGEEVTPSSLANARALLKKAHSAPRGSQL